jgi:ABC-type transporter Mla MlaB component
MVPDPSWIAARASPDDDALVLVLSGRVIPDDLPGLVTRARALLESDTHDRIVCDVGALVEPDAVTVDALARLQLAARRRGREVSLLGASDRLRELLNFCGLDQAIPPCEGLVVEPGREPEERE